LIAPYKNGAVSIDIGTGDGQFVYRSAREHPDRYYIGVDAQSGALEKISRKIYRKIEKGGLPNALFVQSAVEAMPAELDEVAGIVHINFPWGSLLRAVAVGDEAILRNLRRICLPDGQLEIVIGIDPDRDKSELSRLGLEHLTPSYLQEKLKPRYRTAGFEIKEYGVISPEKLTQIPTTWARRLAGNAGRTLTYLTARAATLTETSRCA
jgi:16S rRNA (adenine(1408)-N(1))-methyltransferase